MSEPSTVTVATSDMVAHPEATELLISNLLRTGVVLSAVLVVVGTIISFVHHPEYLTSTTALGPLKDGSLGFPTSFREMLSGLTRFEGRAIVTAGLLVLVATPIMRVAVSILAFVQMRDRKFVAITSIVLSLLVASLILGRAGG